jgi:hypothetical protein
LMNGSPMVDALDATAKPVRINSSLLTVSVPAGGYMVLKPDTKGAGGYTPYKRVQ